MKRTSLLILPALLALTACDTEPSYATHTGPAATADASDPTLPRIELAPETITASPPAALEELAALSETTPEEGVTSELNEQASFEVEVDYGETLVQLASWAWVTVEDIVAVNDFEAGDTLRVGQKVVIPVEEGEREMFEGARSTWHTARLDRYLDKRGGLVGVVDYTVRTGDVAWTLATEEAAAPLWVLAAFNRDADLNRLRIGEELRIPILGDTLEVVSDVTPAVDPAEGTPADEVTAEAAP